MKTDAILRRKLAFALIAGIQILLQTAGRCETAGGQTRVATNYNSIPLHFEINAGQAHPQVKYLTHGGGYTAYFAPRELFLALDMTSNTVSPSDGRPERLKGAKSRNGGFGIVRIAFEKASYKGGLSSEEPLPGRVNFLIGNDQSAWHSDLPMFGRLHYQELYPGIDATFYGTRKQLEYDFTVSPHADPNLICLRFEGADSIRLDNAGNLIFGILGHETQFAKPTIYQIINGTRREISGGYQLNGSRVNFQIAEYDPSLPLVIDPVMSYSTFLSGNGQSEIRDLAVDPTGHAYVVGTTAVAMTNFISPGALQINYAGGSCDIFIAKLNPDGTALEYLTYLGGNKFDFANCLAIDNAGNAYIGGDTTSANFPVTNAIISTAGPNIGGSVNLEEGFIAKINTNGSRLIYSTYIGLQNFNTEIDGITADAAGYTYATGSPGTNGLGPLTKIPVNQTGYPVAVYKLGPSGEAGFTTFFAGTTTSTAEITDGFGIRIDAQSNIWVDGPTTEPKLPVTPDAFQSSFGGGNDDAYVLKLSSNGQTNLFASYLGGNKADSAFSIGIDQSGNIYIIGGTLSANFPTTNALQSAFNGGDNNTSEDGFVTKLNSSAQIQFSTYIGGAGNDSVSATATQPNGDILIVGQTGSIDFAPYANYGSVNHGGLDGYVAKLDSTGTVLKNFAYLGGTGSDSANGVGVDADQNVYIGGYAGSSDFQITSTNVLDPTFGGGGQNGFVAKLFFEPNQLGTKVTASWQQSGNWATAPATTLAASNTWSGAGQFASVSSNGVTSLATTRYQRGASYDPTYTSFVIPLGGQAGIRLDDLGDNSAKFNGTRPWFTRLQNNIQTHLSLGTSTNVSGVQTNFYNYITNFSNPMAAFGSTAGGAPLYLNTQIKFGVYCGAQYESTNADGTVFQSPLRVLVYRLSDFVAGQTNLIGPIATNTIKLPRRTITGDQSAWDQFAANGFSTTIISNGLRTTVELADESAGVWGVTPRFANARSGTYIVTQEATTNAGFGYVLEGVGVVPLNTNLYPMVTNSTGIGWERFYTLDFQTRPPWRSVFIDEPQFNGRPMPSFYQGAAGLTNADAVVNQSLPIGAFTNLDYSPELRRHPVLDRLVSDLNNDPIALANYVINHIELTDALAYNENTGQASAPAVNEGGVNRSALGTYLEGQGSPVEQCALLVYLLRQAGYPAAFVFPTNNNIQIEDTRLSPLLRMQLHGAVDQYGRLYTSNALITVNYPWVVTSISNQCVHIFPWLKDTEVTEGFDLYDYMPTNYDNGFKWLRNYLNADTNILSLSLIYDAPSVLFPKFVQTQLLTNAPGISIDDIGTRCVDRQHYYSRWEDFPTPTVVTNQSQVVCVDSLTSSGMANVSPGATNIFNTVSITLYSLDNTNTHMTVGPLRMADLHNREMIVATNGADGVKLWLAPYLASNTNAPSIFGSDPALTNKQVSILTLTTNDTHLAIRMTHNRHQAISVAPTNQYLGVSETLQFTTPDRPINRTDITALCFNAGRVTPAMLDVHASAYQQMMYQWQLDTNAAPAIEDYQGAAAYLMGMDYYEKVSEFIPVNERLHKTQLVSWFAEGLSKLTPMDLGGNNFMRPSLDMFFSEIAYAGNGTTHPDSGNGYLAGTENFDRILTGEIAAQEHSLLNGFYLSTNSVSSVVLLRLAEQRSTANVSGIIELNKNNYASFGNTNAAGYGPTILKNYDADIWNAVTTAFQSPDADYVRAYITPGPVAVPAASYRGMGLVIVGKSQSASLISVNMNGVMGQPSGFFADQQAGLYTANSGTMTPRTLSDNFEIGGPGSSGGSGSVITGGPGTGNVNYYWDSYSGPDYWLYSPAVQYIPIRRPSFTPPSQIDYARQIDAVNNFSTTTPVQDSLDHAFNSGHTGPTTYKERSNYVLDPVNIMTGEFYHDAVDLTLVGPQPLQLRRNYSSQNLGDRNGFGYGWNINIVPYLGIATNATTNIVISAVDMDGSVIAYRQQTNLDLYLPDQRDNLQLDNFGGGRIGSIYNPFNAKIVHSTVGTNEVYTLTQADGQVRTYVVSSFPIYSPTNTMPRQRPYLTQWQDTEGNTWSCSYGTDPTANDYGSLVRVECSNGNFLGLRYNAGGYVTEAYTGDGQQTSYQYDDFGDLVHVIRRDGSEEGYDYQHTLYTNNSVLYIDSTHLLAQESKPDGRVLQNVYDGLRRVVVQLATVGADLNVYTNGVFTYSNNFTNSSTNAMWGYTLVKDVNGNTNRYDYTNGLVTLITDPLNQTIQQNWYATNATSPGYPRSVWQIKDKRGRWTEFQYDAYGNVTNTFTWGDLTGDGTTQYATNRTTYGSNNLPLTITDPVGNSVQFVYDSQYPYLPQYVIRLSGGMPMITNRFSYCNATNVVVNGNLTLTNVALGLLHQTVRAFNSPDAATSEWSFDGRGFLTQHVQYSGTADPNVTNSFYCNNRGEIIDLVNAAGRKRELAYDDMGRPISLQIFEAGQSLPTFWQNVYYNDNGQVTWIDGPQYNPEDYSWRDYDGAGRLTTEIRWRAEAINDGSGVQAAAGDNLYSQAFFQYDKFGNLTRAVDPRGSISTNIWDPLGRLTQRKFYDLNGSNILSTEGFAYEPGGLVRFYTNALNGVTERQYTTNGLPKYQKLADGSTNAWRYYLDGRVRREIQGNGAYWETTYDDANRTTTCIFYSATALPLATNVAVYDRRGNLIQRADASGATFADFYDDLDRLKASVGPSITNVQETCGVGNGPGCGIYVTNVFQPTITNYFDAAGLSVTTVNTLGEKTVSYFDPLGRPTRIEIRDASNNLVRETSAAYSADFHSVTVTNGSGATAIVSTSYLDNDGRTVISSVNPNANTREYLRNAFDLAGNLIYQAHASSTNGNSTEWSFRSYSYDGLNRMVGMFDRDNAPGIFAYNGAGNLTNRVLPGGLKWQASYNLAGQPLLEKNVGTNGTATRTNIYAYYTSGPFAGLLQSSTDGRGVACTYSYDDWLRVSTNVFTGSSNEYNLTTTWQYEARGFPANVAQFFALVATGPSNSIQRSYDLYGNLSSETVTVGGSTLYSAGQSWDAAGRRTMLSLGNGYNFGWRADGALAAASFANVGGGTFTYDTAGLLTGRTVGPRTTSIATRDGAGRPLSINTTVNTQTKLAETLTWTGDGLPSTHTLVRAGDFTDSRQFFYANLSRRLTEERLNLDGTRRWTNSYTFDNGASSGPGVLTGIGGSSQWSGLPDAFSRIGTETNTALRQLAHGRANGPATITATLDGAPQALTVINTGDHDWKNLWQATMDMTPGAHQLTVSATHPSGAFTTNAVVWFTNNVGNQTVMDSMDAAGDLTKRIWKKSNGTTNLVQTLAWDGEGRLYKVTERDSGNSGRDLSIVYDAFGRRLQTVEVTVTNNVSVTNQPLVVGHYFDPMAEFLELGVNENGRTTWKLVGPDADGSYGGQNGTGGFEAETTGSALSPTISDAFGNVLAEFSYGQYSVVWNNSRLTGYGGVPGYRPLAVGSAGSLATKYAWRNRSSESVGLTWMGGNWLDSASGRFISPDPYGHDGSPSLYSFCSGSPYGVWDSDGRLGKRWVGVSDTLRDSDSVGDNFLGMPAGFVGAIAMGIGSIPGMFSEARVEMARADQEIRTYSGAKAWLANPLRIMANGSFSTTALVNDPVHTVPQIPKAIVQLPGNIKQNAQDFVQNPSVYGGFNLVENGLQVWGIAEGSASLYRTGQRFLPKQAPLTAEEMMALAKAQAQSRVQNAKAEAGGFDFYNMSKRRDYMGATPGKYSSVGQQVLARMFEEGKLRLANGVVEVLNSEGKWVDIESTDMSHVVDAVKAWNESLYKTGAKSPEVRQFMTDPNNYELDSSSINRSKGGSLQETYRPPGTE